MTGEKKATDKDQREQHVAQLAAEVSAAVDQVGALEDWTERHCAGAVPADVVRDACVRVADECLAADPPESGAWEHLLVTLAIHSGRHHTSAGQDAAEAMLLKLARLLEAGELKRYSPEQVVTLAGAMTLALASEDKLTQEVEVAMHETCERFPASLPEIAAACQDIWKRRGQMSGRPGMFFWDTRREEWRLAQDFKPYRTTE
ncbi:MAG: hypothetical protein KDA63_16415 [Planctomycetales bacterium]|nr:hypothetical protein [Planctomycetales bacterium]